MSDWKRARTNVLVWMIVFFVLAEGILAILSLYDFTLVKIGFKSKSLCKEHNYEAAYVLYQDAGISAQGLDRLSSDVFAYVKELGEQGNLDEANELLSWFWTQIKECDALDKVGKEELVKKYDQCTGEVLFINGRKSLEEGDLNTGYGLLEKAGMLGNEEAKEYLAQAYYQRAETAFADGDYSDALRWFEGASGHPQAAEGIRKTHYELGKQAHDAGNDEDAIEHFRAAGSYLDAAQQFMALQGYQINVQAADNPAQSETKLTAKQAKDPDYMLANGFFREAVYYYRQQGDPESLRKARDIITQCVPSMFKFAVSEDGLLICLEDGRARYYDNPEFDFDRYMERFSKISAVATTLNSDGLMLTNEGELRYITNNRKRYYTSEIMDVVAFGTGGESSVIALVADGTLKIVNANGVRNLEEKLKGLSGVVAFAGNNGRVLALKKDGTVTALTEEDEEQDLLVKATKNWKNIVDVTAGSNSFMGLRSDGTVVAVEWIESHYQDEKEIPGEWKTVELDDWKDIIAISCDQSICAGIAADGTIYTTEGQLTLPDVKAVDVCCDSIFVLVGSGQIVEVTFNDQKPIFEASFLTGIPTVYYGTNIYIPR